MRIAIVAPARGIDKPLADKVIALAAVLYPSAELIVHPQCFLSDGHFAGPDAARAAAFLDVANDPTIDAVWFARGGYGSNRILPMVMDKLAPAAATKTWLGYSDLGFLIGALYARRLGHAVHGPMPVDIGREGGEAAVARALAWLTARERGVLEGGLGGRPHAAFNLAILAALIGTHWLPDLTDHVLVIEEVSEPLYRIDRMLCQLARATQLKGVAGVRLGRITDIKPNDPPWAEPVDTMMHRWCAELGVPYLGAADIGHDVANKIVPFGLA
ncbi:LD-carboxypeptidase [Sphingomonas sp. GlSt437]|uniref:LD-carboxypeptidase n=1 Tax=Sphingomonas sp. GlSt437 TaxID=3389970 RepID=UPI003A893A9B